MPYKPDVPGKPGAPIKFTKELRDKLISLLQRGVWINQACTLVGIGEKTYYRWLKGTAPHHLDFQSEIAKAEALCEANLTTKVYVAAESDPELALKFMTKRWNERWGDKKQIDIALEREVEGLLGTLEKALTPKEFERVVSVITAAEVGGAEAADDSGDEAD